MPDKRVPLDESLLEPDTIELVYERDIALKELVLTKPLM
jgi:hypothetical protein